MAVASRASGAQVSGIPAIVEQALSDPAYARSKPLDVDSTLARFGCVGSDTFRSFFERYAGPFGGTAGHELLDLVDQDENIVSQTSLARSVHGFPDRYLVISTYVGNAVLVYDCQTDAVLEVDFEGADRELLTGKLEPRWASFASFLIEYFAAR